MGHGPRDLRGGPGRAPAPRRPGRRRRGRARGRHHLRCAPGLRPPPRRDRRRAGPRRSGRGGPSAAGATPTPCGRSSSARRPSPGWAGPTLRPRGGVLDAAALRARAHGRGAHLARGPRTDAGVVTSEATPLHCSARRQAAVARLLDGHRVRIESGAPARYGRRGRVELAAGAAARRRGGRAAPAGRPPPRGCPATPTGSCRSTARRVAECNRMCAARGRHEEPIKQGGLAAQQADAAADAILADVAGAPSSRNDSGRCCAGCC